MQASVRVSDVDAEFRLRFECRRAAPINRVIRSSPRTAHVLSTTVSRLMRVADAERAG
jgi:hypothetical protein